MNHRQLYKRITNLDRLYGAWDRFSREAFEEQESEAKRGLSRLADGFRKRYDVMVKDRRRTSA